VPEGTPQVYSIAAHRGFADALVAGLVPRYADPELGLARLTLLLPSGRAVRTMTEAFIRHSGDGLLMPRMAVVADLDLDETLGPLLDPLGTAEAARHAGDDLHQDDRDRDDHTAPGQAGGFIAPAPQDERGARRQPADSDGQRPDIGNRHQDRIAEHCTGRG